MLSGMYTNQSWLPKSEYCTHIACRTSVNTKLRHDERGFVNHWDTNQKRVSNKTLNGYGFPKLGSMPRSSTGLNIVSGSAEGLEMELWAEVVVAVVVPVGCLLLSAAVAAGLSILCHPVWLVRWIQKLQPHIVYLKDTQEKVVALTFDDGPHAHITPQLLDALKENHSRATWFIIGDHMDRCPGIVERIYAEGHEVGNHTMRDVASWRLSKEEFEKQLVAVDNRIKEFFHHDESSKPLKWFRPGHGFFNSQIVQACQAYGYRVALGSLYPMDHMFEKRADLLVKNLLWRMHPGAVIILHDRVPQWEQTPQVVRMLLPELRKRGYKVVTLSELMIGMSTEICVEAPGGQHDFKTL